MSARCRGRRVVHASLVLVALLGFAGAAGAHTRSVSYSSVSLGEGGALIRLRVPLLELSRLGLDPMTDLESGGAAARYLADHLTLESGGDPCVPVEDPIALSAEKGWARYEWRVACATGGQFALVSQVLLAEAPSHLHFARVEGPGRPPVERVLSETDPRWALAAPASATTPQHDGTTFAGYVVLGMEHILSGWDHLAFVLALLLLAHRLAEVATLVTSFTVAHSVTLGLAVLGVVHPAGAAVEALIGFSIALVAAENGWLLAGRGRAVPLLCVAGLLGLAGLAGGGVGVVSPAALAGLALFSACHFALLDRTARPERLRAAIAFAFGLVHGFGFAGVLEEMALPQERLVSALFGFNVGVELGQLAIVAAVWPVLRTLERSSPERWHRRVAESGSAAILALGLYWFLVRTLGA